MNKNIFMNEQEIADSNSKAKTACIILINPNGDQSILAMTRKADYHNISFPGGKLEDGETPGDAAVRECFEETGILVDRNTIMPVHCSIARTTECFTFLATKMIGGSLLPKSREGMPMWVNWHMLLKEPCVYKKYSLICITKLIREGLLSHPVKREKEKL
jgi:ADP-ribose pyrophosphatase YjhB (NUDIX family)